jgi:hypothetical protein
VIFISYSRLDLPNVRGVVEGLSAEGVEFWLDESNLPVGQAFVVQLGAALRKADCILLIDTPASRDSYWVSREVLTASRYRREGRYHSTLRLYSSNCEAADAANWDLSVPFDQHSISRIADFVRGRHSVYDSSREPEEAVLVSDRELAQPSNWIGRQDELRALDTWWFGSCRGIWLCGLGGIGKSGLLQTWVTALSHLGYGEAVSVCAAYFMGRHVGVTDVHNAFLECESKHRLLLLDGYDESRDAHQLDDALRESLHRGARVIVTSRRAVPQRLCEYFADIGVGAMTAQDVLALLSQVGITGPDSEELAAELDGHPLAIMILSGSLADGNKSASELLAALRGELSEDSLRGQRSIRVALDKGLRFLTTDARSLLESLCLRPDDAALQPKLPELRELACAGFVNVDDFDAPRQISVHPLVRNFILNRQEG